MNSYPCCAELAWPLNVSHRDRRGSDWMNLLFPGFVHSKRMESGSVSDFDRASWTWHQSQSGEGDHSVVMRLNDSDQRHSLTYPTWVGKLAISSNYSFQGWFRAMNGSDSTLPGTADWKGKASYELSGSSIAIASGVELINLTRGLPNELPLA